MNVQLTEEQKILRESASKFCKTNFESEKLREMIEKEPNGITDEAWQKIAEQGWLGVLVPEAYGGLGLGVTELGIILEEMGRTLAPGPFFSCAALAAPAIAIGGTEEQKNKWLEKIVSGEIKATVALIEEDAELGDWFVRTSDSGGVLSGKKFFVPDLGAADLIVVAAITGTGVTLYLIEKSAPGVSVELNKLTDLTSRSGQLIMDEVPIRAENLLGKVGQGWKIVEQVLDIANVCLAASSIAGAERIFQLTCAYVRERQQFGVPIGSFQAVKHPLANLYADLESARSAYHYAAWAVDASIPEARAAVAVARLTCTDIFRRATLDGLQAHGGIGFTWEYDLHLFLKRAKHNQYFLGTPEDYEEVVAKEALKI